MNTGNLPLHGKRILVTRPAAQADALVAMINARGGEAIRFPLLEIGPPDDFQPLQQAISALDTYALAVFVSPNAVDYSLPRILAARPWPRTLQAATVGPGTVARLAAHGIAEVIVPSTQFDSEALLALPGLQHAALAGKKVLILRGNGGRELLADTLRARGAAVTCVTCYHRSAPATGTPLIARLQARQLDALSISSSEALRHLWEMFAPTGHALLHPLPLFVPHQRIAATARTLGWPHVILTGPGDAGMLAGLIAHFSAAAASGPPPP